jgi:hypothetical protein
LQAQVQAQADLLESAPCAAFRTLVGDPSILR